MHLRARIRAVHLLDYMDHYEPGKYQYTILGHVINVVLVNIRKELRSMESVFRSILAHKGTSHDNHCTHISGCDIH